MIWLLLEATAETPVALPQRAQVGNLYETLPEIPGTAVRGAFAAHTIQQKGWWGQPIPQGPGGQEFERWFENHNLRFGPLRPLPANLPDALKSAPVLPVPRSARSCKYDAGFEEGHGVFDALLRQTHPDDDAEPHGDELRKCPCGAPLEALDSTWLLAQWDQNLTKGSGHDYDPVTSFNTHVGIGAAATVNANLAEEGRLFSLQHFPAGTWFRGWIAVADDACAPHEVLGFSKMAGKWQISLRVGRRKQSYGALTVRLANSPPFHSEPPWQASHGVLTSRWDQFQADSGEARQKLVETKKVPWPEIDLFSMTCVTDLILLDPFLRPCQAVTAHQMAGWLGVCPGKLRLVGVLRGTRLINGWNAAHRLPKETDTAIAAGSVFLFAAEEGVVDPQKLASIEDSGVGWRQSEGFGQVLFCDPFHLQGKRKLRCKERDAVRLSYPTSQSAELVVPELDSTTRFLKENQAAILQESWTSTQINILRDRTHRYDHVVRLRRDSPEADAERQAKTDLKEFLEKLSRKPKMKRGHEAQPLAGALIGLFGLDDDTSWDDVRERVETFTQGMRILTGSDPAPGLEAPRSKDKTTDKEAG